MPIPVDTLKLETSGRVLLDTKSRTAIFNEMFTFPVTLGRCGSDVGEKKVGSEGYLPP